MFGSSKKNPFLQKKQQEKQKIQDNLKQKINAILVQKHIRTYLARRKLTAQAHSASDLKTHLLINTGVSQYSPPAIEEFLQEIGNGATRQFYILRLIGGQLESKELGGYCLELLSREQEVREEVFREGRFPGVVERMCRGGMGHSLMNMSVRHLKKSGRLSKIDGNVLTDLLLKQFSTDFIEVESPYGSTLSNQTILILLEELTHRQHAMKGISYSALAELTLHFIRCIESNSSPACFQPLQSILCYLLGEYLRLGALQHKSITAQLILQNKHIISMIQDEELLQEIENKLRQTSQLQEFTNDFLTPLRSIMTHPLMLTLFAEQSYTSINKTLLQTVKQLTILFQDRRLIFLRDLISSDYMLQSYANSKDPIFYEALKMRLLGMDDLQFQQFNIFTVQEWNGVITSCISIADLKIQKLVEKYQNQYQAGQLVPFTKRNSDQMQLKNVVDLLNNLHKKCLRTGKINPDIFVDYTVSDKLQHFLFGKGARRIQMLLKSLPFVFSFESRMLKFREVVKEDKTHHDRTLFLQEEPDPDLIIEVRRGNQFQDAYQACMTRDLRKKYKIIFFNEQGLQEQGVDGGGIIKQFINRVLKASFGQQYGLFMDTSLNEILPNPNSTYTGEYEFVGRLVGKAVYEGINIEQKFAQPFLNLVIGRQNTFEDLQHIEPQIYQNLLKLKHESAQNIALMEQTFTIYDKLPTGHSKYVDLICPSKPPTPKQTLVTAQNKMDFLFSYANFKCNTQIQQKTRLFRRGFLQVIQPQWLTMFSNQELNQIISGSDPDFNVEQLRQNTLYNDYQPNDPTINIFWQFLKELTPQQKALFLTFVTSCPRPPTLGFGSMKPKFCISRDGDPTHLPTANTCMNVLRLPDYQNKLNLRQKTLYAIHAKAGFEFI